MTESEKMSALDFIISVLKEHEKTLDSLIEKFESILQSISAITKREEATPKTEGRIKIKCLEWSEFRDASEGAGIVSYQIGDKIKIQALKENVIYEYEETVPRHVGVMECGIKVKFKANLDPLNIKKSLSKELDVPEKQIIRGEVRFSH